MQKILASIAIAVALFASGVMTMAIIDSRVYSDCANSDEQNDIWIMAKQSY